MAKPKAISGGVGKSTTVYTLNLCKTLDTTVSEKTVEKIDGLFRWP